MTNISDTINTALGGVARSYPQYVQAVASALNAREDRIKRSLRDYAEGRGLSRAEVDGLFIEVGLDERPAAAQTGDRVGTALADITKQVEDLHARLDALARG